MNKKELLECLKNLSITNNKRDGIDIKKEEAQLITEIINNYKKILDKTKEKINKIIESNNSALSNPEYTIVSKHQLLKLSNEELKDILVLLEKIK